MKTILLVVVAAVAVIGGGVAAANHYDQYKNKQHKAQVSAVEQAKVAQYKADLKTQDLLQQTNVSLKAECEKGVAAYAKLPLSVQRLAPKPVCTPTITSQ